MTKGCLKTYPGFPEKLNESRAIFGESGAPTAQSFMSMGRPFFIHAFWSLGMWASPTALTFPERHIYTHSAIMNNYGVYTYVPKKDEALSPFPAKKRFRSK
jgi:hypothetical protein